MSMIKMLGIDMIDVAGSGHPGIVLSSAPIIYTIYSRHMNINTTDSNWISRDRFVLSAGHGSALLYSTLFLAGYDIGSEDIKKFRRLGYKTPGHPEYGVTPGVDMSTGPLGQGFASSVGMAIGEKMLESKFVIPESSKSLAGKSLINFDVYCLVGDGDLMEGISYEAASLAGTLNLDNLIVLYDSNNISLDGDTSNTFTENVLDRFKAMGWFTKKVMDGTNIEEIDKAISDGKKSGRPSFIEVKTIIGNGSVNAGTSKVHGSPLSKDDIKSLKESLGFSNTPFYVDMDAVKAFREKINDRSGRKYEMWARLYNEYKNTLDIRNSDNLTKLLKGEQIDLLKDRWVFNKEEKKSARDINEEIMQEIEKQVFNFVGGSADLSSSTKTRLKNAKDVKDEHFDGKNIWFGVREHAMGAILNGLALVGFKPFGSTFLSFSDYMKPAIRMSALMNLPVNYIFTHDSILIGPDGPTHQPIEQLVSLRSTPNLNVFRPADANEILGSWNMMLNSTCPNALVLYRQDGMLLDKTNPGFVKFGAYPVRKERENLHGIIIATGSEVKTAVMIAEQLYNEYRLDLRVVSMPCMELFEKQDEKYKAMLLPQGYKTIVIEAGSSFSWYKYVYNEKYLITLDRFGVSGTKNEVEKEMNFSFEQIKERIMGLFR